METTLYNIVTDSDTRSEEALQSQLAQELSAGTPWFDET